MTTISTSQKTIQGFKVVATIRLNQLPFVTVYAPDGRVLVEAYGEASCTDLQELLTKGQEFIDRSLTK